MKQYNTLHTYRCYAYGMHLITGGIRKRVRVKFPTRTGLTARERITCQGSRVLPEKDVSEEWMKRIGPVRSGRLQALRRVRAFS